MVGWVVYLQLSFQIDELLVFTAWVGGGGNVGLVSEEMEGARGEIARQTEGTWSL